LLPFAPLNLSSKSGEVHHLIDKLWEILFSIFCNTEQEIRLKELKKHILSDYSYKLKVTDSFDWGSFAMLVKESAFKPSEIGNHDYLMLPEIYELICVIYKEKYGVIIRDDIIKALKPCIVKFRSNKGITKHYVDVAIYYLYCKFNNLQLSLDTNTCFDGGNMIIMPKDILKIEFLEDE
jgi:hypothetical protein